MTTPAPIHGVQDQVRLPVRVAFQVVLQGMRIRFGRSLVTIMGVVLGIAFLMSILTSQVLKRGVAAEQGARLEIQRMNNFLKAEMGLPTGKILGVVQGGSLSAIEKRFVRHLVDLEVRALSWHALDAAAQADAAELAVIAGATMQPAALDDVAATSTLVLLMGDGAVPAPAWKTLGAGTDLERIATTQNITGRQIPAGVGVAQLAQQLREEELAKLEADKRQEQFRNVWIIIISLLVTVIGISNAMLMSVTERFREIGTMKCLGALSAFIRQIFLFESCLIGAAGGLAGSLVGALFSMLIYAFTFGFGLVATSLAGAVGVLVLYLALAFGAGVVLSIIAAIYPANVASRMVPADALRSNV